LMNQAPTELSKQSQLTASNSKRIH